MKMEILDKFSIPLKNIQYFWAVTLEGSLHTSQTNAGISKHGALTLLTPDVSISITKKSRNILVRRGKWRSPAQPPVQSTAHCKAWPHHPASCTVTLWPSPNTENPHPPSIPALQYQNSAGNHRKAHLSLASNLPFDVSFQKREHQQKYFLQSTACGLHIYI